MTEKESKTIVTRIFRRDAALWISTIVAVFGAAVWAQAALDSRVDAGLEPLVSKVDRVNDEVRRHEEESAAIHAATRSDMRELQADVRALYKAVMTGQPQPRLEADGGR